MKPIKYFLFLPILIAALIKCSPETSPSSDENESFQNNNEDQNLEKQEDEKGVPANRNNQEDPVPNSGGDSSNFINKDEISLQRNNLTIQRNSLTLQRNSVTLSRSIANNPLDLENIQPITPEMIQNNILNEEPEFIVGPCGSMPVVSTLETSIVETLVPLEPNQLYAGYVGYGLDEGRNSEDNFSMTFEPGNYHFVIDEWEESETLNYLGLVVKISTNPSDGYQNLVHYITNQKDTKVRQAELLRITETQTLYFKISPKFISNYRYNFSFIKNGFPIPSPYFTNCPEVENLTVDEIKDFTLEARKEKWFRIESPLPDSLKLINEASPSVENGNESRIQFKIKTYDQIAQRTRQRSIIQANLSRSEPLSSERLFSSESESGKWIRISELSLPLDFKLALNLPE